jgi:AraC-like DNA-binding protein
MSQHHDRSAGLHAAASGPAAPAAEDIDVLSDVLRSVRLSGAMYFLVEASTPWITRAPAASSFAAAVLPRAQHLISYHLVTAGTCWGGLEGQAPERLEAGDILVVPHGAPYFLAAPPDTQAGYGDAEAVSFFERMAAGELPSVVTEGGGGPDTTHFICGFLGCDIRPFNPVLAALPEVLVLRGGPGLDARMKPLIDFALSELRELRSGRQEVLLRLSELMFIETVRRYVEALPNAHEGWLAGLRDPLVARVLALLHGRPSRAWTLDSLAAEAGASRSVLSERFAQRVGQAPMQYLAAWRMQLAARLLAKPGARVKTIAEAVGYDSEAAFSRAFRRAAGMPPAAWRNGASAGRKGRMH